MNNDHMKTEDLTPDNLLRIAAMNVSQCENRLAELHKELNELEELHARYTAILMSHEDESTSIMKEIQEKNRRDF